MKLILQIRSLEDGVVTSVNSQPYLSEVVREQVEDCSLIFLRGAGFSDQPYLFEVAREQIKDGESYLPKVAGEQVLATSLISLRLQKSSSGADLSHRAISLSSCGVVGQDEVTSPISLKLQWSRLKIANLISLKLQWSRLNHKSYLPEVAAEQTKNGESYLSEVVVEQIITNLISLKLQWSRLKTKPYFSEVVVEWIEATRRSGLEQGNLKRRSTKKVKTRRGAREPTEFSTIGGHLFGVDIGPRDASRCQLFLSHGPGWVEAHGMPMRTLSRPSRERNGITLNPKMLQNGTVLEPNPITRPACSRIACFGPRVYLHPWFFCF
ncbi:Thymidylate synthase thyX [Gossypium arboreum]|uniref:Thymidylate synthase thyX n=1 Tax=Gossypium arboreum TaxID=29729 RepID=A0A0B0MMU5_GOSAR|nr:Thymidylate synthase thyX [Gossypium arboreum]